MEPRGLKHFSNFFKEFENDYVIIGGAAALVLLEDEGIEFRATKDLDVVLLTNNSKILNGKISEYLALGQYESREMSEIKPIYYRFTKPKDAAFPEIIEIFARNDNKIELSDGQYTFPVQKDFNAQLSAILLDDEYFNLIKENATKSSDGYSIINVIANICLKARAYRELQERGDNQKKITKHKKDVLRLAQVLNSEHSIHLQGAPHQDFQNIYAAIKDMSDKEIKQVLGGETLNKEQILAALQKCFRI